MNLQRTRPRSRRKYTGPTEATIELLRIRSHGRCEFPNCEQAAQDPHHRFERGAGGVGVKGPDWINNLCNLLAACRHHNDWVSNVAPARAHEMGWRLKPGETPQGRSVETGHSLTRVFLDDVGGWSVGHLTYSGEPQCTSCADTGVVTLDALGEVVDWMNADGFQRPFQDVGCSECRS